MVEINIAYQGDLRCTAIHQPSSTSMVTDAPVDNHGKGESFSPTDLVATALGTCILTTMAIVADRQNIDLRGSTVKVTKEMATKPVRRIASLTVVINVPVALNDEQKQKLIHAAEICPVHGSLHPDVQIPIEFNWS